MNETVQDLRQDALLQGMDLQKYKKNCFNEKRYKFLTSHYFLFGILHSRLEADST